MTGRRLDPVLGSVEDLSVSTTDRSESHEDFTQPHGPITTVARFPNRRATLTPTAGRCF
jgi:hypothetical protein